MINKLSLSIGVKERLFSLSAVMARILAGHEGIVLIHLTEDNSAGSNKLGFLLNYSL